MTKLCGALLVLATILLASCLYGKPKEKQIMETHPDYVIDVRSQEEYASGHLENAICIPHTEIAGKIDAVVPDHGKSIALYCRSGHRAGLALDQLQKRGYTRVENLGGRDAAAQALGRSIVK